MKPYPEYKESGIDWLGEIPSHWEAYKLKYFVEISSGCDPKTDGDVPVYGTGERPFKTCGESKPGPTVLLGRKGTIDTPHWVQEDYWNVDTAFDTKAKSGYLLRFFWYIANCLDYSKYSANTAVPSMTQSAYENMIIPVPTVKEQEAIARYLDEETEKIDALISEKTAQVEDLRAYRSSLITETVTHGLNPDVTLRDSGIDWLGQIPQDWEIKKLKYLVSCNDEVLSESTKRDAIIKYVEISDVSSDEGVKQYSTIKFGEAPSRARRKTQLNDVIISTVRTYLKAIASININNLIVSTGFAVLRPKNINSRFLFYSLSSNKFLNQVESRSTGVSYPAITATDLINIPGLIPPLSEQQEIADFLDEKTGKIDRLIDELTRQLDELAEYRQAVITEAVTGKVDVRDYKDN